MAGIGQDGPGGLSIQVGRDASGGPLITVAGELDLLGADSLREAIDTALDGRAERLTLDVRDLDFIDSAGLAVLIEASSRAGAIELRSPSPAVRRAIELTGLTDVLRWEQ